MPFNRPTLRTLINRAQSDIDAGLGVRAAKLRYTPEYALALAIAGGAHSLHGHLKWLAETVMPDRAEYDYLVRWLNIFDLERKDAVQASGEITVTGTNDSPCPAETLWQRSDGALFRQEADVTISDGSATAEVTAVAPGVDGNTAAGLKLSLVSPVAGINSESTVAGEGITNGTNIESVEAARARLLQRIRNAPKGGGPGDYERWALEVPGVTRAWQYSNHLGIGTVGVTFVLDDQEGSIIPDGAKVTEVQDYIDARRPVTANPTVFAPTAQALDITLSVTPDTAAVRAAVEAELEDFLRRAGKPGGTVLLSQLREAVSLAEGETDHNITDPDGDVTHGTGVIPVLGTITWV